MATHHFEDLEVWKRSARLAVAVLELAETLKLFGLRDQLVRSAISIPSNIAEGAERETDADFKRFLSYAKGSAGELRTQLYLCQRAGYIDPLAASPLTQELKEIGSMLRGLMKALEEK